MQSPPPFPIRFYCKTVLLATKLRSIYSYQVSCNATTILEAILFLRSSSLNYVSPLQFQERMSNTWFHVSITVSSFSAASSPFIGVSDTEELLSLSNRMFSFFFGKGVVMLAFQLAFAWLFLTSLYALAGVTYMWLSCAYFTLVFLLRSTLSFSVGCILSSLCLAFAAAMIPLSPLASYVCIAKRASFTVYCCSLTSIMCLNYTFSCSCGTTNTF